MQKIIAEINLKSIKENGIAFKEHLGTLLCAVVKADGYGHGAEKVVLALSGVADMFAVATHSEAESIKVAACGKDILVLTPPVSIAEAEAILSGGYIASIPDLYTARLLCLVSEKRKLPLRAHIKVNTGLNRYGMSPETVGKVCKFLSKRHKVVEGIYSHIYSEIKEDALLAREVFIRAANICKKYYPDIIMHLSATYGALLGKRFAFDMVRIGLGLYGYLPTGFDRNIIKEIPKLKKAMKVYSYVVASRMYSFGGMGYGTPSEQDINQAKKNGISIIRAGYADGFFRDRDKTDILGSERNAGNLCMDVNIRFGRRKRGVKIPVFQDANLAALKANTISYEVLCLITKRAEFVYVYK